MLISGSDVPIDLQDLRRNTVYSGGYAEGQPYIDSFWRVMDTLTEADRRAFLAFVTSVPRPPLLGFASLTPRFGIQRVPITADSDKLPTASTCFALLKLPFAYTSEAVLRDKLLLAIHAGAGFELT